MAQPVSRSPIASAVRRAGSVEAGDPRRLPGAPRPRMADVTVVPECRVRHSDRAGVARGVAVAGPWPRVARTTRDVPVDEVRPERRARRDADAAGRNRKYPVHVL